QARPSGVATLTTDKNLRSQESGFTASAGPGACSPCTAGRRRPGDAVPREQSRHTGARETAARVELPTTLDETPGSPRCMRAASLRTSDCASNGTGRRLRWLLLCPAD